MACHRVETVELTVVGRGIHDQEESGIAAALALGTHRPGQIHLTINFTNMVELAPSTGIMLMDANGEPFRKLTIRLSSAMSWRRSLLTKPGVMVTIAPPEDVPLNLV